MRDTVERTPSSSSFPPSSRRVSHGVGVRSGRHAKRHGNALVPVVAPFERSCAFRRGITIMLGTLSAPLWGCAAIINVGDSYPLRCSFESGSQSISPCTAWGSEARWDDLSRDTRREPNWPTDHFPRTYTHGPPDHPPEREEWQNQMQPHAAALTEAVVPPGRLPLVERALVARMK